MKTHRITYTNSKVNEFALAHHPRVTAWVGRAELHTTCRPLGKSLKKCHQEQRNLHVVSLLLHDRRSINERRGTYTATATSPTVTSSDRSASHLLESQDKPQHSADSRPDDGVHFHLHLHDRYRGRGSRHSRALDHEAEVAGHDRQDSESQGHDGKSNRRPTLHGHGAGSHGTEDDTSQSVSAQGVAAQRVEAQEVAGGG